MKKILFFLLILFFWQCSGLNEEDNYNVYLIELVKPFIENIRITTNKIIFKIVSFNNNSDLEGFNLYMSTNINEIYSVDDCDLNDYDYLSNVPFLIAWEHGDLQPPQSGYKNDYQEIYISLTNDLNTKTYFVTAASYGINETWANLNENYGRFQSVISGIHSFAPVTEKTFLISNYLENPAASALDCNSNNWPAAAYTVNSAVYLTLAEINSNYMPVLKTDNPAGGIMPCGYRRDFHDQLTAPVDGWVKTSTAVTSNVYLLKDQYMSKNYYAKLMITNTINTVADLNTENIYITGIIIFNSIAEEHSL
ncbi:MAG TPA: hypothetical protein VKS21_04630 [Spirochaetota bacterium]|nr:hypothetical protein [Spirochaetota bacterium]